MVALFDKQPGSLPEPVGVIAVLASIFINLAILLGGPLLISRFPHRSTGRRQRGAENVLLTLTAVAMVALDISAVALEYSGSRLPNPFHIRGFPVGEGDLITV